MGLRCRDIKHYYQLQVFSPYYSVLHLRLQKIILCDRILFGFTKAWFKPFSNPGSHLEIINTPWTAIITVDKA